MKNIFVGAVVTLAALLMVSGCGKSESKDSLKTIQDKGEIVVATSADYPPFEFQTLKDGKNQIVGSDIDLANAIGKELGVKVKVQNMDFNTVLTSLSAGKADLAISGISANEERRKTFDFSTTYYASVPTLLVKKSDADKYKTVADFKGKQVGAQKGSIQEAQVKEQMKDATEVGITSIGSLIQQLKSGQIQGLCLESAIAKSYAEQDPDLVESTVKLKGSDEDAYAIAMPKGSTELKAKVDAVVKKLKADGTIDKYVSQNFELAQNGAK
jgi:polar amino acid transport system substrate-binding protein